MTKYVVGIVGAGHISAYHLKAWSKTRLCRAGLVFDTNPEAMERLRGQAPSLTACGSMEELLTKADIVDICTSPESHAPLIQKGLESECEVIVEKPVVTRPDDWDRLKGIAQAKDKSVVVVHNRKFTRGIRAAKAWIESGRIGEPIRLTRQFLVDPSRDRMLDGPHWSQGLAGGRWMETAPHDFYIIHHLLGSLAVRDVVVGNSEIAGLGSEMASDVTVTLAGDTCIATLHYSGRCSLNRRTIEIVGTEGRIFIDSLGDCATCYRVRDRTLLRPISLQVRESLASIGQLALDRSAYLAAKLRGHSPHSRLFSSFEEYLEGDGAHPTPTEEVDFVVASEWTMGQAVEHQLSQLAEEAGSRSERPTGG